MSIFVGIALFLLAYILREEIAVLFIYFLVLIARLVFCLISEERRERMFK